ncbi:MAG TPA: 1-phosphofructokinase family hexose kinase [Candidatus Angelobacter sp.]|nr:1-phosphofructokinase family hexose kinase [Candidatus Angelobacter sp.]
MLVCISLNPAMDKRACLAKLVRGQVNRLNEVHAAAGGKAAHVAMVLRRLGAEPHWIGFAGGSSGQELLAGLRDLQIQTVPVPAKNATRSNLELIEENGTVTEILEPGAYISREECHAMQSACEAVFCEGRGGVTAILSGSLPPSVPKEFYATLIDAAHRFGGKAFLDASGEPLRLGLEAGPDFIKPNREEAEWLTRKSIQDAKSAAAAIPQLISAGARSAAISLGEDGLVWKPLNSDSIYHAHSLKLNARSAVGSGDATVAGFAYAAEEKLGAEDSLKLAAACGAANCLADLPGQVSAGEVQRFRELVKIEMLS